MDFSSMDVSTILIGSSNMKGIEKYLPPNFQQKIENWAVPGAHADIHYGDKTKLFSNHLIAAFQTNPDARFIIWIGFNSYLFKKRGMVYDHLDHFIEDFMECINLAIFKYQVPKEQILIILPLPRLTLVRFERQLGIIQQLHNILLG